MGLLSKVMPKELSKGLMNSGFLSTEAGTFGRVVGNCWISVAGLLGEGGSQPATHPLQDTHRERDVCVCACVCRSCGCVGEPDTLPVHGAGDIHHPSLRLHVHQVHTHTHTHLD